MRVFELTGLALQRTFYIPGTKYWIDYDVNIRNTPEIMIDIRGSVDDLGDVLSSKDYAEVFDPEIIYICKWVKRIYDESI